jgi:type II secretory pathway component PulF
MATFTYKARDYWGRSISREMDAQDKSEVVEKLAADGLFAISIKQKVEKVVAGVDGVDGGVLPVFLKPGHVKIKEVIIFTRQLAAIYKAGLPLVTALDLLGEQVKTLPMKKSVTFVSRAIREGETLSSAMERVPTVFPEMYTSSVEAGEQGGVLAEVMDNLVHLMEHEEQTKNAIKSAMRYPTIVMATLAGAFTVLMVFVVPQFVKLFSRMKFELPLPTRIMIGMNDLIQNYGVFVAAGFGLLVFTFLVIIRTERGLYIWHYILLKTPYIGTLVLKSSISRFAYMLGLLYKSGMPLLRILGTVSNTVNNKVLTLALKQATAHIEEGSTLSQALDKSTYFPDLLSQMIAVGERTGELDTAMETIVVYYDQEVDQAVEGIKGMIEPVLVFFLGGTILWLALAIFMPMWNMMGNMKK